MAPNSVQVFEAFFPSIRGKLVPFNFKELTALPCSMQSQIVGKQLTPQNMNFYNSIRATTPLMFDKLSYIEDKLRSKRCIFVAFEGE